ncbi:MAG: nucleoside triphosphate pyrophosphohydrolase [Candidatus Diapherotrites archaeon]|nr:nucleoside triphosphate pyrophosphohydrolase [Candidatus Diapherotrites archaeon]
MYKKLVRDKMPEILKAKGETPVTYVADSVEYAEKLNRKLIEECNEFVHKPELEELADILEVIHCLAELHDSSFSEIEKLRIQKEKERGSFRKKIILEKSIVK